MRRLITVLGDRFQQDHSVRSLHGTSESHFATVLPDAVGFPVNTGEIVAIVEACSEYKVPIIPYGVGTSMEGNTIPVRGGLTVDLSRMDAIIAVNSDDFDCTVQAGVTREQINDYLRDTGLFFPCDPGANATIGGMAATRASGTNAVRYGTMREAVLALTVVTADAKIIRTATRARKSAAGYDLTRLFVGSEGTLGIITEITLRLHPIPEAVSSAVCGFETLQGAIDTVVQANQMGVPLARVELLDDAQVRAVNRWSKLQLRELTTLFFEFHGSTGSVAEQVETIRTLADANGGGAFEWAQRPEERSRLWKARHEAYYAAVKQRPNAIGWTTDVCVPISRLTECIMATKRELSTSTIPATILGHVGDGNYHVIFSIDPGNPAELAEVEVLNAGIVARALAMEGTCTGEHGIGIGKQDWLIRELGESVDVMRMLKRALDPLNLFNPGKIFCIQPADLVDEDSVKH